jgi:hypothetical protein
LDAVGSLSNKRLIAANGGGTMGNVNTTRSSQRTGRVAAGFVFGLLLLAPLSTLGDEHVDPEVQRQLDEMQKTIDEQRRDIDKLRDELRQKKVPPVRVPATNVPTVIRKPEASGALAPLALSTEVGPFEVGYEKGFVFQPVDPQTTPFKLRVTGRMQFRHSLFRREDERYVDNTGDVINVRNRNDFEIERGRLTFDGFALLPQLGYYINLDFDTDDEHNVIIHDFWVDYVFSDAFILYAGKAFVPGSREWLMGSTTTRFSDRSLATTFFRPDRSLGIWAIGEPLTGVYYRTMLANGFNTTDLTSTDIDNNFAWASSAWWDAFDNFGSGWSDLEWHEQLAIQTGLSFTIASQEGKDADGQPDAEQNFARLSDGTRLVDTGALAPGVTVDEFDLYLFAVDLAAKYYGFSINGEYYFRWIDDLKADGPLPLNDFFDHGFYVEGGYMVIPKRLELSLRTSHVFGRFGDDGAEYGGAVTWFILGAHNLKVTLDVTRVYDSPAQNSAPGYRVGDDGYMMRTQLQVGF